MTRILGVVVLLAGLILPSASFSQVVNPAQRNIFRCTVVASTATTIQAVGGSCVAPGARLALYVTDIIMGSSVISSTAADSALTLKAGTGGTCGTATVSLLSVPALANTSVAMHLIAPMELPTNNELCWIHSPAGTKWITILGYIDKG